jgi:hypothetical protein
MVVVMFKIIVGIVVALQISSIPVLAKPQVPSIGRNCTTYMDPSKLPSVEIKIAIDKLVSERTQALSRNKSTSINPARLKALEDMVENLDDVEKKLYMELLAIFQKEAAQSVALTVSK